MTTATILLAILAWLSLGLAIYAEIQDVDGLKGAFWFLFGFVLAIALMSIPPSAMDVYQGKTELEYTVRGNEVVDSVVVYKKLEEEAL